MLKRNKKIILLLTMIFIFSSIGLYSEYEEKMEVKSQNVENVYFTERILQFYILGVKDERYFLNVKPLGISKKDVNAVGVLKSEKKNCALFTTENSMKLYSIEEGNLKTYKLSSDEVIISTWIADLDNDFNDELLIITGKGNEVFGDSLIVFSFDGELKEIFKRSFKDMNPWKVEAADVDGDGIKEISMGVYKKSEFHPIMAKRPFIYNWHGNDISPKWRGSRLSRPFEDYIFADIDGDGLDEIISIEINKNGKKLVNSYKWKGFGFQGMAESNEYDDILAIEKIQKQGNKDNIIAKVKNGEKYGWVLLSNSNERLEVKKKIKGYIKEVNIE